MADRTLIIFLALLVAGPARAADALPPVTAAERAAAFPDVAKTDMHRHMNDDPLTGAFEAEQFEWQERPGDDALKWDVIGWLGHDMNRIWLRDEGEHVRGDQVQNQLELLWGRPVAAWWDVVAGIRNDTGPGPTRTYAAVGVQGLAPQWFDVEATAYLGERGQAGLRLQAEYQVLFTNRLIGVARGELHAWSKDDEDNGIGDGISEISAGLRVRYEVRREFAPYAGLEWVDTVGDTADLARAAGEDVRDTRLVAGVHFWF